MQQAPIEYTVKQQIIKYQNTMKQTTSFGPHDDANVEDDNSDEQYSSCEDVNDKTATTTTKQEFIDLCDSDDDDKEAVDNSAVQSMIHTDDGVHENERMLK